MKKILLASCITSISAAVSADVNLPNIGIDGWDSDSQYFRSAAFSQGYLTASGTENHTVNPAYALDMMDSAEARMDASGNFSGGVFANIFNQNMGVYFGRPMYNGAVYDIDTDGDGEIDDDLLGGFLPPSNVLDAYWASNVGMGQLGIRLNYNAIGYKAEDQLDNEDVDDTTTASLYEFNSTVGLVSNSLPLEATITVGVPFGGFEEVEDDDTTSTKTTSKVEVDKGLKWGATAKYRLRDSSQGKTLISGFIGSSSANYNASGKTTDTDTDTTTVTSDTTYEQERFSLGLVGSVEQVINSQTRLVSSAGVTRTSSKIGLVDNTAAPAAPNYDEYVFYTVPVAVGVEFRKSEKTMLIGSVSSNLFDSSQNRNFDNDGGDGEEVDNESFYWTNPSTSVEFGVSYQMLSQLNTSFVIDKSLFNDGLDQGLTTTLQFNYEF